MSTKTDVAIVGAGPYGLSIAAHLSARGVAFRIFGQPMESWLEQMPRSMLLKSEGFASSLYDPAARLTLGQYCRDNGRPYEDMGLPVPLQLFCDYGLAFQQRMVPSLDRRKVTSISTNGPGFLLELEDSEKVAADRVVMAVGISHFSHLPRLLADVGPAGATHSSAHRDLTRFKGKDVLIIGAGASAIDLAGLLHEAGAGVRLAARRPEVEIHTRMRVPRPLSDRLRAPMTGIGPSWRSWLFAHGAGCYRHLPLTRRLKWVRTHLGPAGGWFMADRVRGRVPLLLCHTPIAAMVESGRVRVTFARGDGGREDIVADHVIAATGYRPDLERLTMLGPALRQRIAAEERTPVLSRHFESSVPNLYFVGPIAANRFGPLMRFAVGAKFVAPRLARHLAATERRSAVLRSRVGAAA
jgi:cation diffusion facilitator CzcD-associated flavoprotein CzcO